MFLFLADIIIEQRKTMQRASQEDNVCAKEKVKGLIVFATGVFCPAHLKTCEDSIVSSYTNLDSGLMRIQTSP